MKICYESSGQLEPEDKLSSSDKETTNLLAMWPIKHATIQCVRKIFGKFLLAVLC